MCFHDCKHHPATGLDQIWHQNAKLSTQLKPKKWDGLALAWNSKTWDGLALAWCFLSKLKIIPVSWFLKSGAWWGGVKRGVHARFVQGDRGCVRWGCACFEWFVSCGDLVEAGDVEERTHCLGVRQGVVGVYPVVLTECDGILDEVGSGTGGVQIFDTGKSGVLVHPVLRDLSPWIGEGGGGVILIASPSLSPFFRSNSWTVRPSWCQCA
jgi:hypothetical protein